MFRTRFKKEIVAEFLPPARARKQDKAIILCDGMPSIPRKQALVEFLAGKGYWVFYPRWRGAWESGGQFLERSPHEDILDVVDELRKPIKELAFGETFHCSPRKIFVIGGSFGGAASILCSLDERITKVIANCPVVDWGHPPERTEKRNFQSQLSRVHPRCIWQCLSAFRHRLEQTAWRRILQSRASCEGVHRLQNINVPCQRRSLHSVEGRRSVLRDGRARDSNYCSEGGHLSTEYVVRKYLDRD